MAGPTEDTVTMCILHRARRPRHVPRGSTRRSQASNTERNRQSAQLERAEACLNLAARSAGRLALTRFTAMYDLKNG
jgi:hypothetical protein